MTSTIQPPKMARRVAIYPSGNTIFFSADEEFVEMVRAGNIGKVTKVGGTYGYYMNVDPRFDTEEAVAWLNALANEADSLPREWAWDARNDVAYAYRRGATHAEALADRPVETVICGYNSQEEAESAKERFHYCPFTDAIKQGPVEDCPICSRHVAVKSRNSAARHIELYLSPTGEKVIGRLDVGMLSPVFMTSELGLNKKLFRLFVFPGVAFARLFDFLQSENGAESLAVLTAAADKAVAAL